MCAASSKVGAAPTSDESLSRGTKAVAIWDASRAAGGAAEFHTLADLRSANQGARLYDLRAQALDSTCDGPRQNRRKAALTLNARTG